MTQRDKLIELLDTNCGYVDEIKAEELADRLLENGIVVLPVNVGDKVYSSISYCGDYEKQKDKPYQHTIVFIDINGETNFFHTVNDKTERMFCFDFSEIGKTVFLTHEAAQKALEALK